MADETIEEYRERIVKRNARNKAIFDSFPDLFGGDFDRFGRYLDIGDGWIPYLNIFLKKLSYLLKNKPVEGEFSIQQVKEKFGQIRIYLTHHRDDINDLIRNCEEICDKTCEVCGKPGTVRNLRWIKTLCDEHMAEQEHSLGQNIVSTTIREPNSHTEVKGENVKEIS